MRVHNPKCPPFRIHGRNTAPTPTGFTEIVSYLAPTVSRGQSLEKFRRHLSRRKRAQRTARGQELNGDLTWRGVYELARPPITASPHRRWLAVAAQTTLLETTEAAGSCGNTFAKKCGQPPDGTAHNMKQQSEW
jgi:hypothetical protein